LGSELELVVRDLVEDGGGLLEHVKHRLAVHPLGSDLLVLLEQLLNLVLLVEGLDETTRRKAAKIENKVRRKEENLRPYVFCRFSFV